MSPTLLELAAAIVLIVAAWQLGLALAPIVMRMLRGARQSLDDVSDEALATPDTDTTPEMAHRATKEHSHDAQQ